MQTPHSHDALSALSGHCAQLNKEKEQRRAWAVHSKQKQVFEEASEQFSQLSTLRDTLEGVCAEPSRTGKTSETSMSKRRQMKQLRDEMRASLANIDRKLAEGDSEEVDPVVQAALAAAKERLKLPPHLRGSAVLNETL